MEARRTWCAVAARLRDVRVLGSVAVAGAIGAGLLGAHRAVERADAAVSAAESRFAASAARSRWPVAAPPITASISTIAASSDEHIEFRHCRFEWHAAAAFARRPPEVSVAGTADSLAALDAFIDRLAEHAFLGEVSLERSRASGDAVEFELRLGSWPSRRADSIVAAGGLE